MQPLFLPRRSVPHKAPLLGFISAGNPLDPTPFTTRRRIPIPPGFRRFGMFVFQVDGNSMTLPDGSGLPHGSFLLVDSHDVISQEGHVYAFRLADGSLVAKRLRLRAGRPAMYSDNPSYSPIVLDREVRRCGRVYAFSLDGRTWEYAGYRPWSH
ncbi:S24 family peptidase [Deinococcus sp. YIM 77859]|uniref:S24 family peptidase n=1 Tax=Deinococcus sp. YIM 77859 TaxID=1540221 RepID=UPI0006907512|nr:S24 family peptidase [Deinococcus sp. YIM 77859]